MPSGVPSGVPLGVCMNEKVSHIPTEKIREREGVYPMKDSKVRIEELKEAIEQAKKEKPFFNYFNVHIGVEVETMAYSSKGVGDWVTQGVYKNITEYKRAVKNIPDDYELYVHPCYIITRNKTKAKTDYDLMQLQAEEAPLIRDYPFVLKLGGYMVPL